MNESNLQKSYTVRVSLEGIDYLLPFGPPLGLIVYLLVGEQFLQVHKGAMRLAFHPDARLSEEEMQSFTLDDAISAAMGWVCWAASNASDLLLAVARETYNGSYALKDLLNAINERQIEWRPPMDFKSLVHARASFKEKGGGEIIATIRDKIEAVGRELYRAKCIAIRELDAENFLHVNRLSPHGRACEFHGRHVSETPVFFPCLARAVKYQAELILPSSKVEAKVSCHRCDLLSTVYDRCKEWLRSAAPSPLVTASVDGDLGFVINARITAIPGTGFGEKSWSLPEQFVQHGLAVEQMGRQAIGKQVISGIFPLVLWDRLPQPVHEFLLQAAHSVGDDQCPPFLPRVIEKEELDDLIPRVRNADDYGDLDDDTRRSLGGLGILPGEAAMPMHLCDILRDFREIAFGDSFDETFSLRRALDLYPLHKRVLGLLEYRLRGLLETTERDFSVRLREAFKDRRHAHRLDPNLLSTGADSKNTSLEIGGGWVVFANDSNKTVPTATGPGCSLAELIDRLVDRIHRRYCPPEKKLTCTGGTSRKLIGAKQQAEQLAFLEGNTVAARRSLQAISNIIVNLRNFPARPTAATKVDCSMASLIGREITTDATEYRWPLLLLAVGQRASVWRLPPMDPRRLLG